MTDRKLPFDFEIVDGVLHGSLAHGLSINGNLQRRFEMREATVDDLLDSELEADVSKPLNFNAQLLVRQLIKVGDFEGPFTVGMIRRLKPVDWRRLRAAQTEVDVLGEGESASAPGS